MPRSVGPSMLEDLPHADQHALVYATVTVDPADDSAHVEFS